MMSKALPNNFHPARRLFVYSIKRTAGLTVLMTVAALLACPVYTLLKIERIYENTGKIYNLDNAAPMLMFFTAAVSVSAALVYMFINFAFLYSRSSSDFFHSLPATRTGLLFARLLASVLPITVPVTLVYGAMCGLKLSKYVECSIAPIVKGYVFNLLILFALSAFSLIFMICAGNIFDLIISFFTFNIGIVLVQIINSELCQSFLKGYPGTYAERTINASSPFWFAFASFGNVLGEDTTLYYEIIFAVKLLIITFFSLAVCLALYRRRKSEKSGISYAYNFIYIVCGLIVGILGAFGVGSVFAEGDFNLIFWVFGVVGGVLAAVTFGAINDRGFKNLKKSAVMGTVSVALLGSFALILISGCFGYNKRIPEKSRIESATVEFSGSEITVKNPDNVLKLHESIIENYDDDNADYLNLDYTLKSGNHFLRRYNVDYNDYMPLLLELYKSPEHIESIRSEIFGDIVNNRSVYSSSYVQSENTENSTETVEDTSSEIALTEAELKKLIDAYISDLPKATYKSITGECYVNYQISGVDKDYRYQYFSLNVEENFENTLRVAKELGIVTP